MAEKKNTHLKAISRTIGTRGFVHSPHVKAVADDVSATLQGILAFGLSTLAAIITIVIYHRTLAFPFQFDDLLNITKNFSIRNIDLKLSLFASPRWIGELSNKLNFKLGHFCPWSYRTINLAIHLLCGTTFGAMVYKLGSVQGRDSFFYQSRAMLSSFCCAFFLLHPVQSQTVNYAIQARLEGLSALFSLFGALLMMFYATSSGKRASTFLGLACLVGFLSCGTKEIVIVAPFLAVLLDYFFVAKGSWQEFKGRVFGHLAFGSVIFLTTSYYMGFSLVKKILTFGHSVKNNRGNIISTGVINQIGPMEFLMSEFKVLLHYIWIFFVPQSMSVEYDYKLASGFFQYQVIVPLLALIILVATAFYLSKRSQVAKVGFCGLVWFFFAILPRASVIPCAELVGDYKTYLASCGLFLLFASSILGLIKASSEYLQKQFSQEFGRSFYQTMSVSCFFVLALIMAIGLDRRNNVWSDQELFWADIVEKAPNKARANNNLAVAMCEKGKYKESIVYLERAINLDHFYADPWSNLAVSFSMLGKPQEAIKALEKAISIMPNYPEAYNNIGAILIGCREYQKAIEPLKKAIELRPHYGKAYLNLGRAIGSDPEKRQEAWQYFKKATELDLDNIEGYVVFGNESVACGKFDHAAQAFEKACALGERSKGVLMNLAGSYCQSGKLDKGLDLFWQLYRADKNDQAIAYNLVLCMDLKGEIEKGYDILPAFLYDQNCPDNAVSVAAKCIEKARSIGDAKKFLSELLAKDGLADSKKQLVQSQLQRIALQEKIDSTGGVLTGKDFNEIFGGQKS